MKVNIFVVFLALLLWNCSGSRKAESTQPDVSVSRPAPADAVHPQMPATRTPVADTVWPAKADIVVGATRFSSYLPMIKGKTVALVVNHTSMVGKTHLADTLQSLGVQIKTIFAPEHGFRGTAADGEVIKDGHDARTGILLVSLYGKKHEPSAEDLAGTDWVIFDIQDVGVRFYTYISTMHYVMNACAKHGVKFMVLDRPNPNARLIDGPIRQPGYESFVGMHPIPVAHGMTIGEYARMVNGEGWLDEQRKADLTVITCENYNHRRPYELPVPPSPNLPDMRSVYLYPSTCFFEGTVASEGRGTPAAFQLVGHPDFPGGDTVFTPMSRPGAPTPKLQGKACRGFNLTGIPLDSLRAMDHLNLDYLISFYRGFPDKANFFLKTLYIDKLAGGPQLRVDIVSGKTETEIRAGWQEGLKAFKEKRKKYLLYP